MELKRVIDKRTICMLLVATVITCLLFYNQQIQNGTQEILQYNSDYTQGQYTIFDVNTMYQDMLAQYTQTVGVSMEACSEDSVNQFMGQYYKDHIDKTTVSFPIYKMARSLLEDNIHYTTSYDEDIQEMRENALKTVKLGAFSDPSSFAYNNILKTRYDLKNNETIKTTLVNTRALDSIYQYKLSGYMILFLMIYVVYRFIEERKNGLWHIIRMSSAGRCLLALKRAGILALAALLFSLVVNTAVDIESYSLYGGLDSLHAMVQSSREFTYMTLQCNGAAYLLIHIMVGAVAAFALGLLIWALIAVISSHVFAGGILVFAFTLEYLAYRYIPSSGIFGILKYANIIQMVNPMDGIVNYTNCALSGFMVSRQEILPIVIILITCAGMLITIVASEKKYPIQNFSKCMIWMDKLSTGYNHLISKLPSYGLELCKLFIYQKGIFVIIVSVFLISGVKIYGGVYYDAGRDILRNYYNEVGGSYVNDTVNTIVSEYEKKLDDKQNEYQELDAALQDGQSINYSNMKSVRDEIEAFNVAIPVMHEQIDYLNRLKKVRGVDAEIISVFSYENVLGGSMDYSQNLINLYVFLIMIFLMNANFAYERKGNMVPVIKSCANGRKEFIRRKIGINVLVTVLLWGSVYGYYLYRISHLYDLNNLDCSVLSISMMQHFPVDMSIRVYLVFSLLLKLVIMLAAMMVITMISLLVNDKFTIIVSLILVIPHVLYILGFGFFQYLSVILPMNNWQMERLYNGNWVMYVIYLCIMVVGIVSFATVYRKWTGSVHK